MTTASDTSSSERVTLKGQQAIPGPFPEFVDWIVGAIIALGGFISLIGGTALVFVVDRATLAEGIESGTITVGMATRELTATEMLEVTDIVVQWAGTGMVATGIGMVLFAIGYVVARHRAHRRAGPDDPVNSYRSNAVVGAIATVLLSFLPFSPGVGGALAGYLERGQSERTVRIGALAGFLAMAPFLLLMMFVFSGLVSGMLAINQGGMAVVMGVQMLFFLFFVGTTGAVLGGLGGYVGGRFAESRMETN